MLENEITHLVAEMPDLAGTARVEIEQHYLSKPPEPLRIRSLGGAVFELTKKLRIDPDDESRKDEITIPLTSSEYADLRRLSMRFLTKTRYLYPLAGGLTAEIDVFHGPLEGLVTVEVEFPDEDARRAFDVPPWFGRDITQEPWAGNSRLAGMRYEDIAPLLAG